MKTELLTILAQAADALDQANEPEAASEVDTMIQEVAAAPEEEIIEQLNDAQKEGKLTKKQLSALKAFTKASKRVLEVVSVGSKEFPDPKVRSAIRTVLSCLEECLGALDQFSGEIANAPDQVEEEAKAPEAPAAEAKEETPVEAPAAPAEVPSEQSELDKLFEEEKNVLEQAARLRARRILAERS